MRSKRTLYYSMLTVLAINTWFIGFMLARATIG